MTRIAITADTTCAISKEEAKALGLHILPLNVIVDGVEYHDGVDIDNPTLTKMMRSGSVIKTSTPTFKELEDFFDGIFAEGYDKVIHFTISGSLSSMYSMFTLGCEERYGDKVVVIDSQLVCSYMGNLVKFADKLNKEGRPLEEIVEKSKERAGVVDIFFLPESMEFLKRGGRVSPAIAAIGGLLGIKPVLTFKEGTIGKYGTARSLKQIAPKLIDELNSKGYNATEHEIHIVELDADLSVKVAQEFMSKAFPDFDIKVTPLSINVAAHTGPGTIGIGIVKKI